MTSFKSARARRRSIVATRAGKQLLACWLCLALCGCTGIGDYFRNGFKVGPNYGRPQAPVENDWIDTADVRVRKDSDEHRNWWVVFNDPVLNNLVCTAYNQNLTLREAGFRVMEAQAAYWYTVGTIFPQQQFASGGYARNAISKQIATTSFINPRFFSVWNIGLNLGWELDFWGRYRRAIEAADADLDASIENYDDALVTLLGELASTYVQLRQFERQIETARANAVLQAETLKIATARFEGGQTSEIDVDQAQSELELTNSSIREYEILQRNANNRICILLGRPPVDLRSEIGSAEIPIAPPDVALGIPAELLSRRPDIRRAERQAAAQSARIGVATSDLYPHISIVGSVGFAASDFTDLFKDTSLIGAVGPTFQWNILNYGRLVNRIRIEDARFDELVTAYQSTVLKAGEEVEDGLIQFLRAHQKINHLNVSTDAALRAVRLAVVQYRAGTVDFNRVALLQQNLLTRQQLLLEARGEAAAGLIKVYRALGGGWQVRLDGCELVPVDLRVTPPAIPPLLELGAAAPRGERGNHLTSAVAAVAAIREEHAEAPAERASDPAPDFDESVEPQPFELDAPANEGAHTAQRTARP